MKGVAERDMRKLHEKVHDALREISGDALVRFGLVPSLLHHMEMRSKPSQSSSCWLMVLS